MHAIGAQYMHAPRHACSMHYGHSTCMYHGHTHAYTRAAVRACTKAIIHACTRATLWSQYVHVSRPYYIHARRSKYVHVLRPHTYLHALGSQYVHVPHSTCTIATIRAYYTRPHTCMQPQYVHDRTNTSHKRVHSTAGKTLHLGIKAAFT